MEKGAIFFYIFFFFLAYDEDVAINKMESITPSTQSTVWQESPVESDSFHELRLDSFAPQRPQYEYLFDREYLRQLSEDAGLPSLTRLNLLPVMHTVMESIESRALNAASKKRLAMDTLMFWSEHSGLSLAEFDLYLLSATIDLVAHVGRHGTIVNQRVFRDTGVQTDPVKDECRLC